MNCQPNSADSLFHKIVFCNLRCKINLSNNALFAFLIRIGKTSSKYTQKKEISEGFLQFDTALQLPLSQITLQKQSVKKEKCEIMLYKFRQNREKQSKELVGMASITISPENIENGSKRLRLTNSFDKEAFIECKMMTELGQADILSQNISQSSFIHIRSQENSLNHDLSVSRAKQNAEIQAMKNNVKIELITSNSKNSLRQQSNEKDQGNNSLLDLLMRAENESNIPMAPLKQKISISQQTIPKQKQQQKQKEKSETRIPALAQFNSALGEQNERLKEMCRQLQQQNIALKSQVQNLQNQALSQSMYSNNSVVSQNPNIPKPGGISKRSPMIKKNASTTVIPSFSKIQGPQNVLPDDLKNGHQEQVKIKLKGPKKGEIIRAQGSKLNNSLVNEQEKSSYFSGSRVSQLKLQQQQLQLPLSLTFAGERQTQRNPFYVTPVIQVKFIPPVNIRDNGSNGMSKSVAHSSISDVQRKNNRSYMKFNGKKKYQIVGAIQNQNSTFQIHTNSFDQDLYKNSKQQGGSILVEKISAGLNKNDQKSFHINNAKQSHFIGLKTNEIKHQNNFLDFLKEKDEIVQQKQQNLDVQITSSKVDIQKSPIQDQIVRENKNRIFVFFDPNGLRKSRLTLEDLDIKTQEMFRKNERILKISNMRISEENNKLKKEKKALEQEIQTKKGLTHEELQSLKTEINLLKEKLQKSDKITEQSQKKRIQMTKKFSSLEEENAKLKKDLRQQKSKYEYYFKMSNINDEKQKERQNIGPGQKGLNGKKSGGKLSNESFESEEVSKVLNREERSMTSISNLNKEDSIKTINHDRNFMKKGDGSLEKQDSSSNKFALKKVSSQQLELSKPVTSSTAVSKLKMHIKPIVPKSPSSGVFSAIPSPANSIQSGSLGELVSGLVGTGQTIVQNQRRANFFSKK